MSISAYPTFHTPSARDIGQRITLSRTEAHHADRVLRISGDSMVRLVDGKGRAFIGMYRSGGEVEITDQVEAPPELPGMVHVWIGILKNRSRFEFAIEKSVELGASAIHPLATERTERKSVKIERMQKIVESAMKQCGRAVLPSISDVSFVEDAASLDGRILICHEKSGSQTSGNAPELSAESHQTVHVFVGPEGGFSDSEVDFLVTRGAGLWHFGQTRFRTETAAIYALASIRNKLLPPVV